MSVEGEVESGLGGKVILVKRVLISPAGTGCEFEAHGTPRAAEAAKEVDEVNGAVDACIEAVDGRFAVAGEVVTGSEDAGIILEP